MGHGLRRSQREHRRCDSDVGMPCPAERCPPVCSAARRQRAPSARATQPTLRQIPVARPPAHTCDAALARSGRCPRPKKRRSSEVEVLDDLALERDDVEVFADRHVAEDRPANRARAPRAAAHRHSVRAARASLVATGLEVTDLVVTS
eukprot:6019598-Prymnesium_polylepis.1